MQVLVFGYNSDMKILIMSDSHGHIVNLKHVMGFAKTIGAKAIIHCGDWDTPEAVKEVLSFGIPLYSVLGNADIEPEIEDLLKFKCKKFEPNFLKLTIDGQKIGITHRMTKRQITLTESLNMVFSGHYHSKEEKMVNFTTFVRPGALINGLNFVVYETINNKVEFFSEG